MIGSLRMSFTALLDYAHLLCRATKEDESRRAYIKKYSLLRDTAARAASASSQTQPELPYDFTSPLPSSLSSVDEVIAYGQSLQAAAKAKLARPFNSSPAQESNVIDVEAEVGISLSALRLQVCLFRSH